MKCCHNKFNRDKKAQSFIDYAFIAGAVTMAVTLMLPYAHRGVNAVQQEIDNVGNLYSNNGN